MSSYIATVVWTRQPNEIFKDNRYSRAHTWAFDGLTIAGSAAPGHVPRGTEKPDAVDPEEAFVASLSSCHMLFFLYHAARFGAVVEKYEDAAVGELGKTDQGRQWMSRVTLNPRITWGDGKVPSSDELAALHHQAHEDCYIANSVKTEVLITQE